MRYISRPVPEGLVSRLMRAGVLRLCSREDRAKPTPRASSFSIRLLRVLNRISPPWG